MVVMASARLELPTPAAISAADGDGADYVLRQIVWTDNVGAWLLLFEMTLTVHCVVPVLWYW